MEIIFKKTSHSIKNPLHLKRNFFIIYSPRTVKIKPASCIKVDTELFIFLQKNSKGFITFIFRGDKINEFCSEKQRLWIEILNKSFEETVKIKKNQPLGFLAIETENLKFKYETTNKKKKTIQKKKAISKMYKQKQYRQRGCFLNQYDFAYAGRDKVNQAAKVAPGVIKAAANNINTIANKQNESNHISRR